MTAVTLHADKFAAVEVGSRTQGAIGARESKQTRRITRFAIAYREFGQASSVSQRFAGALNSQISNSYRKYLSSFPENHRAIEKKAAISLDPLCGPKGTRILELSIRTTLRRSRRWERFGLQAVRLLTGKAKLEMRDVCPPPRGINRFAGRSPGRAGPNQKAEVAKRYAPATQCAWRAAGR